MRARDPRETLADAARRDVVRDVRPRDRGVTKSLLDKEPKRMVQKQVERDKRPHCKPRPKNNRSSGGGGKGFIPWC